MSVLILLPILYLVLLYRAVTNATIPQGFSTADFMVRCGFVVGIFVSIVLALYGDYWKEKVWPIKLKLEVTSQPSTSDKTYFFDPGPTFNHYLLVKNLTAHKPIKECRIWLKNVERLTQQGTWERVNLFVVPRQMQWAPSQYSQDKRTFCTWQFFHLGKSLAADGGSFSISTFAGNENDEQIQLTFGTNAKLKLTFFATAENYLSDEEFSFTVVVRKHMKEDTACLAVITPFAI